MQNLHATAVKASAGHASTAAAHTGFTISGWWQSFQQKRRIRGTEQALRALSDRTLKDIGIDRSEIGSVARATGAGRRRPAHSLRTVIRFG